MRQRRDFPIFELIATAYFPAFLFSTCWGAVVPIVPILAKSFGATVGVIGLVVTMRGIGTLVFDLPAGMFVARVGSRRAMVVSSVATVLSAGLTWFSHDPITLAILTFFLGGFQSVWMLSRLTHVRETVGENMRGRALSMLGGSFRLGSLAGPIAGGFVGQWLGLQAAYLFAACIALAGTLLVGVGGRGSRAHKKQASPPAWRNLPSLAARHRSVLMTAGLVVLTLGVLRSGRQILIPLWGNAVGLNVDAIGLVLGIGSAIDMALFYPAGTIMDRLGRKSAMLPCLLILSVSFVLMPAAHGFIGLTIVSMVAGLGNGFGSGIVMTLGADLAPDNAYGEFLGIWRLVGDLGSAAGPALIGVIGEAFALSASPLFAAVVGIAGAVVMVFFTEETKARKRTGEGRAT